MTVITHSLLKSVMCNQTQAWSRGFTPANSIPGVRVHEGWDD
jgi:hypothetical protein